MNWITTFLTSSIGKKLIMSLTGLFLVTFLIVHLVGNLQLLAGDGGEAFNVYAYFMTHNPLIKTVSFGLYAGILLHAIQGILIAWKNKKARGTGYKKSQSAKTSWASRNMALLGLLITAFLLIHMGDFWFKMKFTEQLDMVNYEGMDHAVKDLFKQVSLSFTNPLIVIAYVIGVAALGFHLWHGFQSAFQTLGLNHKKYTPIIKAVGKIFSVAIFIGYVIMPITIYLNQQ